MATALMTLHSNADLQRAINDNPWRPTASDVVSNTRYGSGHQPPTVPAAPSATAAPRAGAGPIFGIVAGVSDLLPPRFNGERRADADDWAQDFCDYVALRRISPTDEALLFRTRLMGAARTWLEGVPADVPLEDAIARFRKRFGAGDACRPELVTDFWERRQGPGEKTCRYIEEKARLARRMRVEDEQFVVQGTIQGMRADVRRDLLLQRPTTIEASRRFERPPTSQMPAPELEEEVNHTATTPP